RACSGWYQTQETQEFNRLVEFAYDSGHRANGREVKLADGSKLFLGGSGTGPPYEIVTGDTNSPPTGCAGFSESEESCVTSISQYRVRLIYGETGTGSWLQHGPADFDRPSSHPKIFERLKSFAESDGARLAKCCCSPTVRRCCERCCR